MQSIDQYYTLAATELQSLGEELIANARAMRASAHKHPFDRALLTGSVGSDAHKRIATAERMITRYMLLCELQRQAQ